MKNRLLRITGKTKNGQPFVAGIVTYKRLAARKLKGDAYEKPTYIHECAPILRYMETWTVGEILRYCNRHNWTFELEDRKGNIQKGPRRLVKDERKKTTPKRRTLRRRVVQSV